ncbi:capsular polysaccharide transport system ATP-binding protein [Novosphingobium hassiacum]|uniref:Capsular polysaccharide transport system ATP-binding protein n=1 Tax=Novosphingobium hassiacum TaxID=173676 RepID=A0A7W6EV00_9SPHN|nr:ABC transporter ATP-binding protein [Novosphingobium hassiacum]MBB3859415.1 capsular polysaccharide transport system ATP-binding protein [Novosphingobium hassiacum]
MIRLEDVTKSYHTRSGLKQVLRGIDFQMVKGERVGFLGRNGAGKSTLIRLISGAELPDTGSVVREMSVSWPLAFGGAFQNALTGIDNLRFICRIYGVSVEGKLDYVQEFSELGDYIYEPLKSYSSGMRARLAFAISMVIEFDCFLIDEVFAVGDDRFQRKCHVELFEKRADRGMIFVSHNEHFIRERCDRVAILHEGRALTFDDMDDAYDFYKLNYG